MTRTALGVSAVLGAVLGAVVLLSVAWRVIVWRPADGAASAVVPVGVQSTDPPASPPASPPATPPATRPADAAPAPKWTPPRPPASKERVDDRMSMVRRQISDPGDLRRAVRSEPVLDAMRAVPRHVFMPEKQRDRAYSDTPLPIGHGQTISQPYIVAYMTEMLELEPDHKVLEIGTGSGYQAAVLGQLTPNVFTIEIIEPLAERSSKTLRAQGYDRVTTRHADGYYGWKEHAPFDRIIVTAAAGHVPPPLWEQLRPGGRMVIPVGGVYDVQRLLLVEKTEAGERRSRSVMAVRFVPLTGGPDGK